LLLSSRKQVQEEVDIKTESDERGVSFVVVSKDGILTSFLKEINDSYESSDGMLTAFGCRGMCAKCIWRGDANKEFREIFS
jgi:hypothetical protein